jgi:hypothetical protein
LPQTGGSQPIRQFNAYYTENSRYMQAKFCKREKSNSEKGRSAVPAAPAIPIVPPRGTPH